MSKSLAFTIFEDKLTFFTTGKSLSGLSYINDGSDFKLNDALSNATGLNASYEFSVSTHPDQSVHQAQQSVGDEHDIVNLVDKLVNFGVGVEMPVPIESPFVSGLDFHTAMNAIKQAERDFIELPAHIRSEFDNDPGKFLDFFHDEKNSDRARELGFFNPKDPDKVLKVDVVDSHDRRASLALKKAKEEAGE